MPEFSARVAHRGATTVVELVGDVDYATSAAVIEAVRQALAEAASELVIDLRAATFIDSVGVDAAIASPSRVASSTGMPFRVEAGEAVRLRLHLMGLDDLLERSRG